MAAVIVLGAISVLWAGATIDAGAADPYLLLLSAFTLVIGSRATVRIPRFKSHISVSDTFIFLVLLLYGGPFAVLLAGLEAAVSAWRFCNKKVTVLFNAATMAVSTSAVVLLLKLSGLYYVCEQRGESTDGQSLAIALSLIALTQFLVNTSLATIYDSLVSGLKMWDTWKTKYVWSFFSYFVGIGGAAALVQLSDLTGFGVILAACPVIFFVFLSYKMYLKNVEISVQQAEQAEEYASILESQSVALRESEERFRSAFDHAPIGIGLVSATGEWLKVNRALISILGYTEEQFLARDYQSMIHEEDIGTTLVRVHEIVSGKVASCQMEQRYVHSDGHTVWSSWSVSTAGDAKPPNLIFQIQDITGKKIAEEKLQHEATHDVLTGLPNRLFFMNRLNEALEMTHERRGYRASVLFIDLDRFKYVNDSLGHIVGDELLKEIAVRLRDCLRPADIVARLGGDEFTILVQGNYDEREVTRIADRIQQKFSHAFSLLGHEIYSSASIGILHATEKHVTSEDVMRDADTAMYQAKKAGKARHEVFDEKMHNAAKEILRLETDLRRAVEREEIAVYYQPIYDLETGTIDCLESLARWDHPELGRISPSKFIPLAEEIGLIDRLCEQVMRRTCDEIGSLNRQRVGERELAVSINLSCRQFSKNTLVETVRNILRETEFAPTSLKIEITESVFFEHKQRAIAMLNDLKQIGIEINVDDFGTGYSNLGYLRELPITALKIDRTFVSMIDENGGNDEIVRAIITMARNLGLSVIAEGVETQSQLELLRSLDCEGVQGFLFAEPMNFASLRDFLCDQGFDIGTNRFADISAAEFVQ